MLVSIYPVAVVLYFFAPQLRPMEHTVSASAEAVISVKPDQAHLSIAVTTHATTAQQASTENATKTTQVISAIKPLLSNSGQLTTSGYGLAADYQTRPNGTPGPIIGYHASNHVLVTTNDIPSAGQILDIAIKAGANEVDYISFGLRDNEKPRREALQQAAAKARADAEAIATALGVHVVGIQEAQSGELPIIRQFNGATKAFAPAMQTPLEAGDVSVHATVTVTLEVK